jgi:hypothetical protein
MLSRTISGLAPSRSIWLERGSSENTLYRANRPSTNLCKSCLLVLEDKGLRNYGTDAARTEQACQGSKEMDKKKNQIAHRRIVAGREILRKYGQSNNSPATGAACCAECQRPGGQIYRFKTTCCAVAHSVAHFAAKAAQNTPNLCNTLCSKLLICIRW